MYNRQQPIPKEYIFMSEEEREQRIRQIKKEFGSKLIILGHHYQRDDVICYADYRGDSLRLAQLAAKEKEAEYIVFCGVHFMAETADMLTKPEQKVILPDLEAGCPMADMAEIEDVEMCWEILMSRYAEPKSSKHESSSLSDKPEIIPVTYVNSSAEVKAFCGRYGGMTCTSSNAPKIFDALLSAGKSILFLPDKHLGRNTGLQWGLRQEEIFLWEREKVREKGEIELTEVLPKLILWDGYCNVHQKFEPLHIDEVRQKYPGVRVIVHPECSHEVVEKADLAGSTDYIIRQISESAAGSVWAVGTEINLVLRLAKENPDKKIISLNETICLCVMMNRISPPHLLWALENLKRGEVVNQISVDEAITADALKALERMLELS